jgi:hypothetical protein
LFVDLARAAQSPTLYSHESYLSAAADNHGDVIANVLLMWYMFLGGHVEEDTFWAVDKTFVEISSLPFPWLTLLVLATRWKPSSPTCPRE